ncbi:MAG TPA: DUF2721 domain-containing protein [Burkholderiales bacterium]|jgi:Protein of unknown function (DUF2721)
MNGLLMDAHVSDIARIIQLAVAPVFLLTAIGTILSALNNRLGRIVDRRRLLEDRMRKIIAEGAEPAKEDISELALLAQRIGLIYHAIMFAVVSGLLICILVAMAFMGVFISIDLARVVSMLFILSMFSLIGCLALLLREIFIAVKVGQHDILVRNMLR